MPPPVLEISKESFHHYDIFDKTAAYSEIGKQEGSKRKILISTLFKETKNSRLAAQNFEPNVIQNKIITVPLGYVIVVMALLTLCTIASILICVYPFRTCDEESGEKNT